MKQTRERKTKIQEYKSENIHFVISASLKKEFYDFCEKNGFSFGKRMRALIQKDLIENNK